MESGAAVTSKILISDKQLTEIEQVQHGIQDFIKSAHESKLFISAEKESLVKIAQIIFMRFNYFLWN